MEKCISCQFYDRRNGRSTEGKTIMWGQCRRHSPHLNPVTAKAHVIEGVWPLVRDDDWCGEWKVLGRSHNIQEANAAIADAVSLPRPRFNASNGGGSAAVSNGDD